MGNSLQDYRAQVGLFHSSAIHFKSRTSQYHVSPSKGLKKPKMKVMLIVCLLLACFISISEIRPVKAHFSQYRPSYPAMICVEQLVHPVGKPHHPPGGADDPLDPGEQVQWDQLYHRHDGGTGLYNCKKIFS